MNIKPWKKMQEVLPPLSSYERKELSESLKQYGIKDSILIWKNQGLIIDGNTRWELLEGKIPQDKIEYFEGSEEDAFNLGIQLNFARRQLSNEQKKEICRKLRKQGLTQQKVAEVTSVPQRTISYWEGHENTSNSKIAKTSNLYDLRISVPKKEYETIHERQKLGEPQRKIAADFKISQQRVSQIAEIVEARTTPQETQTPSFPNKKYSCLIIDPPWPVKKIEREERSNQGLELAYPTMTLEEITKLPIPDLADSNGCHVYLWVTHKFLPEGLRLFEKWGVKYQCVLTWIKPTGMTPFSWMYNTEHVLFGRIGSLYLLRNGVKLSFREPVVRHSRKPDIFYNIVRKVSPEPRLELFAREKRLGFEAWGNEVQ